mmetsp:Transcript_4441/g.19917  ORF Transcript_4441/g.19917 Transcript_4441/m.19917 type:complete len:247 (-) Transcript_4441:804-1544(-)
MSLALVCDTISSRSACLRLTSVSLLSSSLPMSARSVWSCRDSALGLWSASLEPRDTALTSSPMPASRGLTIPPVPFGCCVGSGVADPPASLSSSLDPPPGGAPAPVEWSFPPPPSPALNLPNPNPPVAPCSVWVRLPPKLFIVLMAFLPCSLTRSRRLPRPPEPTPGAAGEDAPTRPASAATYSAASLSIPPMPWLLACAVALAAASVRFSSMRSCAHCVDASTTVTYPMATSAVALRTKSAHRLI